MECNLPAQSLAKLPYFGEAETTSARFQITRGLQAVERRKNSFKLFLGYARSPVRLIG